jgi:thioredoxin 1
MKVIQNQSELESMVKKIGDGVLVIKFYADWCGPCKIMKPVYENLSADPEMSFVADFVEINRDDNMDMITELKFDFMSIPRFFAVKIQDGSIVDKKDLGGSQTKTSLVDQIKEYAK